MLSKIKSIVIRLRSSDSMTRKTAKNMLLSGISRPISLVLSYVYVPIALHYLDVEKYGVWATIMSILSWIGFADIGIGNGLRNRLTESIAKHDDERSRKLVSSAYAIIAVVMAFIAIILGIVFSFLDWHRILGVGDINENLKVIVTMSMCFVAVNFILSICTNVLYALQEAAVVSYLSVITQIVNLIGVVLLTFFSESNLFYLAVLYGFSMLSVNLIANIVMYCGKHRNLAPRFKYVDRKVGIDLTSLGLQFFVIQICALVLFTTDSLIISRLYGASDVTPYSIVNKVFTAISGIYSAFLVPVWSSVTMAKTQRNFVWLRKLIRRLHLLMLPFFMGACLAAVIFRPLCGWWLQKELVYSNLLIWLGFIYCILNIWCNTYAYIGNGMEIMKIGMAIAITQAIVNIPLSLFFAKSLGMASAGVLLGTIVAMSIAAVTSPFILKRVIDSQEKSSEN